MRGWDDRIYLDKELEIKKANGLCTICQTKIKLDYIDGEYIEICVKQPIKATKTYMFMHLCDEHYNQILKTVHSIRNPVNVVKP